MAAYGALVSVMQIMDQLHRHPHPPISIDKNQSESLTANVTFLQEFLEGYNPRVSYTSEADPLESRIAEAAYAAEDVIESYIVDQIRAQITDDGGKISSTEFYQGLEKVIQEMDLIKVEVTEKKMQGVQIIKNKQSTAEATSSRSSSSTAHKETTMVGLDEVLIEMLDKIARGPRARQIIPIVGMGGLGKTTLARNIYEHQLVKEHFDICAWSTISQVHNARKILTEILKQVGLDNGGDLSEGELGLSLYKHLMGKRYMIVMDDMWNIEAWDKVRNFFPENENGSRVVVTTRLSNLASMFDYSSGLDMKFMDEATSWNLFCKTVFGEETCPLELEDVGKKIVEGCRGLPLSIVVVGGLLSKSKPTAENWQVIEENLSSVVNSEDGGSCLQILYMSYNNLPVHIKPCFLYMGVFPEDEIIPVRFVIPLWVAEGFIKPVDGKSLEELGEEYLQELIDRNLVLVGKRNRLGKLKSCKVHDLVRDLCLREGEKDKFLCVLKQSNDDRESHCQGITSGHRRVINFNTSSSVVLESVEGATASSLVRTLMGKFPTGTLSLPSYGLLRVCMIGAEEESSDDEEESSDDEEESRDGEEIVSKPLNLRFAYLFDKQQHSLFRMIFSSAPFLWNVQTLVLEGTRQDYILDIRKMPLLRHVFSNYIRALCLPDPPPLGGDEVVLKNLHTLEGVCNLKLSEEVVRRIQNIRILKLYYHDDKEEEEEDYCLNNLQSLNKLDELDIIIWYRLDLPLVQELSLPYSLKQLKLRDTKLPWEEMSSKIGCLPLLQVLILQRDAFIGSEWETVEGQFLSLRYLEIRDCKHLEQWVTDDCTHFPRLEQLALYNLDRLREIPSCIGDIPTLRSIKVSSCSDSAIESGRRIQEEQEEYDNQLLQIHIQNL